MNETYQYRAKAQWTRKRLGVVQGDGVSPPMDFSAPPEFLGKAGLWTPEHLLVSAVASCFVTTFQAIAEFSKFESAALEVSVEGTVEKVEKGFRFTRFLLRPVLRVGKESDRERGLRLLEKAERSCFISRSLSGEVTLHPVVEVTQNRSAQTWV